MILPLFINKYFHKVSSAVRENSLLCVNHLSQKKPLSIWYNANQTTDVFCFYWGPPLNKSWRQEKFWSPFISTVQIIFNNQSFPETSGRSIFWLQQKTKTHMQNTFLSIFKSTLRNKNFFPKTQSNSEWFLKKKKKKQSYYFFYYILFYGNKEKNFFFFRHWVCGLHSYTFFFFFFFFKYSSLWPVYLCKRYN